MISACEAHTYLIDIIYFVFVQRIQPNTFPSPNQRYQTDTRLYSLWKKKLFSSFFCGFSDFNDFHVYKVSVGKS